MIKFPSIEQFRNVIRNVQHQAQFCGLDSDGNAIMNRDATLPVLSFQGTVKAHGSNCGLVYDITSKTITYQSRERELSLVSDNAGCMLYLASKADV